MKWARTFPGPVELDIRGNPNRVWVGQGAVGGRNVGQFKDSGQIKEQRDHRVDVQAPELLSSLTFRRPGLKFAFGPSYDTVLARQGP